MTRKLWLFFFSLFCGALCGCKNVHVHAYTIPNTFTRSRALASFSTNRDSSQYAHIHWQTSLFTRRLSRCKHYVSSSQDLSELLSSVQDGDAAFASTFDADVAYSDTNLFVDCIQDVNDSSQSFNSLPLHELALVGSLATFIGDIAMHPVDCIKTLQQSDAGFGLSFLQAANYLWDKFGIFGFYHGILTFSIADASGGALKFAVWELWKQKCESWKNRIPTWMTLWIGAGLAFVASSIFIVPGEFIKQQLQVSHYDGFMDAITSIYTQSGFSGFFVGYEGVLFRDVPYTILELSLYEVFKSSLDAIRRPQSPPKAWEQILAAAATGGITAFLTTPIDVIKTKLMVDTEYINDSFVECLMASVQHHGWESVLAGALARVGLLMPITAIYLPTYDFLKMQLLVRRQQSSKSDDS